MCPTGLQSTLSHIEFGLASRSGRHNTGFPRLTYSLRKHVHGKLHWDPQSREVGIADQTGVGLRPMTDNRHYENFLEKRASQCRRGLSTHPFDLICEKHKLK